mmetsp:Transcript_35434/g.57339  ORF Transcript_35434/g.57339 Transcript_35434/m.57339 type:complete len:360 (-) Transcript_35434:1102-2181(-)
MIRPTFTLFEVQPYAHSDQHSSFRKPTTLVSRLASARHPKMSNTVDQSNRRSRSKRATQEEEAQTSSSQTHDPRVQEIAFDLFSTENRMAVQLMDPSVSEKEVVKLMVLVWRNLPEERRQQYVSRVLARSAKQQLTSPSTPKQPIPHGPPPQPPTLSLRSPAKTPTLHPPSIYIPPSRHVAPKRPVPSVVLTNHTTSLNANGPSHICPILSEFADLALRGGPISERSSLDESDSSSMASLAPPSPVSDVSRQSSPGCSPYTQGVAYGKRLRLSPAVDLSMSNMMASHSISDWSLNGSHHHHHHHHHHPTSINDLNLPPATREEVMRFPVSASAIAAVTKSMVSGGMQRRNGLRIADLIS